MEDREKCVFVGGSWDGDSQVLPRRSVGDVFRRTEREARRTAVVTAAPEPIAVEEYRRTVFVADEEEIVLYLFREMTAAEALRKILRAYCGDHGRR